MKLPATLSTIIVLAATAYHGTALVPLWPDCTFSDFVTTSTDSVVTVWNTTRTSTYSIHCFGCGLTTVTVPGTITVTPQTVTGSLPTITTITTVCSIE